MLNFHDLAQKYAKIALNDKGLEKFQVLADFLINENKKFNLTAIRDQDGIYLKHFLDSLTLNLAVEEIAKKDRSFDLGKVRIVDFGSGAGFPALPLAIVFPETQIVAVESIGKKCRFIEAASKELSLSNLKVVQSRVEDLPNKQISGFEVVTCRAVTRLPKLIEYTMPILKKGGYFIAMKNEERLEEEIRASEEMMKKFSGKITKRIKVMIPELSQRELVIIQKI